MRNNSRVQFFETWCSSSSSEAGVTVVDPCNMYSLRQSSCDNVSGVDLLSVDLVSF